MADCMEPRNTKFIHFMASILFSAPHVRLPCTEYKIKSTFYINTLQRNFKSWGAKNLFPM